MENNEMYEKYLELVSDRNILNDEINKLSIELGISVKPLINEIDSFMKFSGVEFDSIQFTKILLKTDVTNDVIDKNFDKIDWMILSHEFVFSKDQLDKYHKYINWLNLNINSYRNMDIDMIRKYKDKISWDRMSYIDNGFKFRVEFKEKLNWNTISINSKLSEEEIELFADNLNWSYITISQDLSEDFLIKWCDKLDAGYILFHNPSDEVKKLYENRIIEYKKNQEKEYREVIDKITNLNEDYYNSMDRYQPTADDFGKIDDK